MAEATLDMATNLAAEAPRRCVRCVMDTSDPDIQFDEKGQCQYCTGMLVRLQNETFTQDPSRLAALADRLRAEGKGKPYDCVIGVSGGVDSTYVAYVLKRHLGLRPLAVHLDNGWNSETAVANINTVLDTLGIDLKTHVVDWDEFRDLQMSFFKASVVNIEIATDHAINALLYKTARQEGIRFVVTGGNIRSEGIYPRSYGWYNLDLRHLKAIHRRFGTKKLKTYPTINLAELFYVMMVRRIVTVPILNYLDYNKPKAMEILQSEIGWRPYGGKHFESVFTRYYQGEILPKKFGLDKRISHLSCLVTAGDMSRDDAITELQKPPYDLSLIDQDREFVIKKLELSEAEFELIMKKTPVDHRAYPTNAWFFDRMPKLRKTLKKLAMRV